MYHSITFGDKNTWDDWHLIPESRPVFAPPKVKAERVDPTGRDGELILTPLLVGHSVYENRSGSFEFAVENGFKPWYELYSEILNYLHGRKMRAVLEDDPTHYYEGRFYVGNWESGPDYSKITIDYDVEPFEKVIGT